MYHLSKLEPQRPSGARQSAVRLCKPRAEDHFSEFSRLPNTALSVARTPEFTQFILLWVKEAFPTFGRRHDCRNFTARPSSVLDSTFPTPPALTPLLQARNDSLVFGCNILDSHEQITPWHNVNRRYRNHSWHERASSSTLENTDTQGTPHLPEVQHARYGTRLLPRVCGSCRRTRTLEGHRPRHSSF